MKTGFEKKLCFGHQSFTPTPLRFSVLRIGFAGMSRFHSQGAAGDLSASKQCEASQPQSRSVPPAAPIQRSKAA